MDEFPKIYDARVAKEECAYDVEDHRHGMELCVLGIHGQLITTEPILSGDFGEDQDGGAFQMISWFSFSSLLGCKRTGVRRKEKISKIQEKTESKRAVNGTVLARNLRRDDLS